MKRRIRKKKRLGEFVEYGFRLAFEVDSSTEAEPFEALLDRLLEKLESMHLQLGGGGHHYFEGFIESSIERHSATESQRKELVEWCAAEPLIHSYYIGPLVDAWHGDFDESQHGEWVRAGGGA